MLEEIHIAEPQQISDNNMPNFSFQQNIILPVHRDYIAHKFLIFNGILSFSSYFIILPML